MQVRHLRISGRNHVIGDQSHFFLCQTTIRPLVKSARLSHARLILMGVLLIPLPRWHHEIQLGAMGQMRYVGIPFDGSRLNP
jgi:hypothetical protein